MVWKAGGPSPIRDCCRAESKHLYCTVQTPKTKRAHLRARFIVLPVPCFPAPCDEDYEKGNKAPLWGLVDQNDSVGTGVSASSTSEAATSAAVTSWVTDSSDTAGVSSPVIS